MIPHDRAHDLRLPFAIAFLALVMCAGSAAARNYSELNWNTLTTEHFMVHFADGNEKTARRAAAIAEEVYPSLTELYGYEPKTPTHLIIRDTDDFANGAAFYYNDKFEIWATSLEFNLRGTHNWLRDVITHEFAHMVSLQAAQRMPHAIPALYLQGFGYEEERREDVLIGYPNVIMSYPIPGTVSSAWWAEGVAQYQTSKVYNDWWDSHRDMLLRSAVLDGTLLTYDQMGDLSKNGLEAEMVYNQGNNLVRWIAATYGEGALHDVTVGMKNFWAVTENGALEKGTGKSGQELYDAWKADLEQRYGAVREDIERNPIYGTAVSEGGYLNLHPKFRPGSNELYWASNQGRDYGALALVRRELDATGTPENEIAGLVGGLNSPVNFTTDGQRTYYAKRIAANRYSYRVNDIYILDIEEEKEERLTRELRSKDPAPSPDGQSILAILNADATNELVLLDAEGKLVKHLTQDSVHGTQYYQPLWSEDGTRFLFTTFDGVSRDIGIMDVETGAVTMLADTPADERDPAWVPGENAIVFASDRTGIFNIYRLDLDNSELTQVTNVLGSALYPAVREDGLLAFSSFAGTGYEIRVLQRADWGELPVNGDAPARGDYRLDSGGIDALSLTQSAYFDGEVTEYVQQIPVTHVMPRIVIDNGKLRLGAYVSSSEILDKQSIFAGGNVGRRFDGFEFEAFVLYENRMFPFTIFGDAFRVRRRSEDVVISKIGDGASDHVGEARPVNLELRYDVVEYDAGVRYEWGAPTFSLTNYMDVAVFYRHQDYNINLFATDNIDGTFYGKDGWTYYKGDIVEGRYRFRGVERAVDMEINPRGGRQVLLRTAFTWASLNPSGARDIDSFQPLFEDNQFGEYEFDWREFVALPGGRHSLELRARGGLIDDLEVDDFFHFAVGSSPGLRGYTFYARQGRKIGIGAITYRFPIFRRIDQRFAQFMLHRLYGGIFYEAGNTWDTEGFTGLKRDQLLTDAGFELRLETTSFYIFPADFHYTAAYGFDNAFDFQGIALGGKEWRHYFSLLFGF